MIASEYGWKIEDILDMKISILSKMVDIIKERHDVTFMRDTMALEWQTQVLAVVTAKTAQDESGKFAKEVGKMRFPWKEFGYPEVLGEKEDDFDPNDLSYLETGDLSAADKNAGKNLPSLGGFGI